MNENAANKVMINKIKYISGTNPCFISLHNNEKCKKGWLHKQLIFHTKTYVNTTQSKNATFKFLCFNKKP